MKAKTVYVVARIRKKCIPQQKLNHERRERPHDKISKKHCSVTEDGEQSVFGKEKQSKAMVR